MLCFSLLVGWFLSLGKGGVTELAGCWLVVVEMLNVVALTLAPALAAVVGRFRVPCCRFCCLLGVVEGRGVGRSG